jgi:tRNA (guanine37-N1)-methyltransferase
VLSRDSEIRKDLKFLLIGKLQPQELDLVFKSYDVVGGIVIIRVPEALKSRSQIVAEAIMQTHKNVRTVLLQTSPVSGDFRLRQLEWVAGEKKTTTVHKEFGCLFEVDLERCYFSPRLSFERRRVASLVQPHEIVVNMFAGVGCFSIVMARHSKVERVFSIDVNPVAFDFMLKNVKLNRVQNKVVPVLGDAKKVVREQLSGVADRVLMPLPEKAYEYLDYALMALKPSGGWVHYYDFVHAGKGEKPVEKVRGKVTAKLNESNVKPKVSFGRVVRATGPYWFQVVVDLFVAT